MHELIIACVVLWTSIAHADQATDRAKAVDAMLAAQTKALIADDDAALDKTMTKDGLRTFDNNRLDNDSLWGYPKPQKMTITAKRVGWAGSWGWIAAEVRVTGTMYAEPEGAGDPNPQPETALFRWIAIVELDGTAVKTKYMVVLSTEKRGDTHDENYVQALIPNAKASALVTMLATPATVVSAISDSNAVAFGSNANEVGYGSAKAKKLLESWKKLTFQVADTNDSHDKFMYVPEEKTFGDGALATASLRYLNTKTKRWVRLEGVIVARKVGDAWQPLVIAYSP